MEENKYYIGSTTRSIDERFCEHLDGSGGAVWTNIYKPIEVIESKQRQTEFDEDLVTKQYMKKYGIENVRGGSYSQVELRNEEITVLQKEIRTATNACFQCGQTGHFISECRKRSRDSWASSRSSSGCSDSSNEENRPSKFQKRAENQTTTTTPQKNNIHIVNNSNSPSTLPRNSFVLPPSQSPKTNLENKQISKNNTPIQKKSNQTTTTTKTTMTSQKKALQDKSNEIDLTDDSGLKEKRNEGFGEVVDFVQCFVGSLWPTNKQKATNHFIKDNQNVRNDNYKTNRNTNQNSNRKKQHSPEKEFIDRNACFRCGRTSHWARDCFAKTDIDGDSLGESD